MFLSSYRALRLKRADIYWPEFYVLEEEKEKEKKKRKKKDAENRKERDRIYAECLRKEKEKARAKWRTPEELNRSDVVVDEEEEEDVPVDYYRIERFIFQLALCTDESKPIHDKLKTELHLMYFFLRKDHLNPNMTLMKEAINKHPLHTVHKSH